MIRKRVLPKIAAVVGVLAAAALTAVHVNAWFFSAPGSGSHVQQDFEAAGFTFTTAQRFAGALLEGLPTATYVLAILMLVRLLWSRPAETAKAERVLVMASSLMLAGAVLLLLYPPVTSVVLSMLEPTEAGLFLLSFQPVMVVAVIGSVLFSGVVSCIRDYLQATSPAA